LRVGVALATFNGERFLPAQLQSLLHQTRAADEIVAVDDASIDGSVGLLERFADRSQSRTEVLRLSENRGVTNAFTEAIRACKSELILLCDQDDVWHPSKIERYAAEVESSKEIGLVVSDSSLIDDQGVRVADSFWRWGRLSRRDQRALTRGNAFRALLRHPALSGHSIGFRASLRESIFPVPPTWTYDAWLSLVVSAQAPIRLLNSPMAAHRLHSGQTIGDSRESLGNKIDSRTAASEVSVFEAQIAGVESLRDRLEVAGVAQMEIFGSLLDARVKLLENRKRMRQRNSAVRARLILGEAISGRYWSVGRGWIAVARDLLSLVKETQQAS
jgi:hypothetical protein